MTMVLFLQRFGVPSGRPALCAKNRQARPLLFPKTTLASGLCEEGRGLKKLASQPFPPLASSSQKEGAKEGSQGVKPKATSSRACQPPGRKQPRRAQNVSRDPHSDDRCHGDIQEFSRETRTGTILNRTGSLSQVSSFVFFFFSTTQDGFIFKNRRRKKKKKKRDKCQQGATSVPQAPTASSPLFWKNRGLCSRLYRGSGPSPFQTGKESEARPTQH